MNKCEYVFWVDFKEEHCANDLEEGSKELVFLEGLRPLDWHMGRNNHFNSLPRGLVKGDAISYDPFWGDIDLDNWDYKICVDGRLIVTEVDFAFVEERNNKNYWKVHVDCYCDRFIIHND